MTGQIELPQEDLSISSSLDQVMRLKNGLEARAQNGQFEGGDAAYRSLRSELRRNSIVWAKLPIFVKDCADISQFWNFIRPRFPTYQERREFIWKSFAPIIEYLEAKECRLPFNPAGKTLAKFNAAEVQTAWEKALNRRTEDPDGAITAARALIETVCKHILDDEGIPYTVNEDLPNLWHRTAKLLNLAPGQHQDELFKAILGNCQTIVDRLGAMRNSVGDAHGRGRDPVKPTPRHAELAVNLAGSMAAFVVATWLEQKAEAGA